jgi:hypothetical protein
MSAAILRKRDYALGLAMLAAVLALGAAFAVLEHWRQP